jgi:plasmid stabilization system protein ParE
MPRGDKSAYTDKQKRQAEHIEESMEARGMPKKQAEARAWATVNKNTGGGNKSGSGRGKPDSNDASKRGGRANKASSPEARSAAARKGWITRRKNVGK